jgi:hypothetical protein
VPESKGRKKATYTPPPRASQGNQPSGRLYVYIMCIAFVVGLAWIVTFYVSGSKYPIPLDSHEYVNLVIGFAIVLVGFVMATRWR